MWAFTKTVSAIAALVVLALPQAAEAAMISLSGEVTYRERIALPPGAVLRIRLIDMTAPDTPARVDVQAPIGSPGQVPLSFGLNLDDQALVRANSHGLVAEILSGNELWFRNEEPLQVDPFAPAAPLVVVTTFAGRIAVAGAEPQETASVPAEASEIVGITWRATAIAGEPTLSDVDSTLLIDADRRVGGRGGCNSYFAQADISGSAIRFSAAAATRMACLSDAANAQETAFFAAIEKARYWRVGDDGMVLLDADENEILRFAAMTR